ncbi:hypothetical protein C2W64_03941 [Brevibacillus laterosporus]|nr:DNA-binding protein [Brevibacillus laterosporus]RAP19552.1 hypothetical protein C2W64_03941 [Brevibacillus laterosporus]
MSNPDHIPIRSLRSEIEKRIKLENYTLTQLGALTHINQAQLSAFLKGRAYRALTIAQLDAIASVFEEPAGWLYELYIEECFPKGAISRRRVDSYLLRCAEIGRHDCIEPVVSILLERRKNVEILFIVAERLFHKGKHKESVSFYQLVIDNVKDNHSEQFIMSHYRLFQISEEADIEEIRKSVIRFESYRKRLSEHYQLDALLLLANKCLSLHQWRKVEKYASELIKLATLIYRHEKHKRNREVSPFHSESRLVVYYGQGYLLKSVALEKQGLYEEAKEFVSGYADLSWFELLDKAGQAEVDKFRLLATANTYRLDILMGNTSVLADYIKYLEDHPTEILFGLVTIMESASIRGFLIDSLLERFSEEISYFHDSHDPIDIGRHLRFRYDLATYHFQNDRSDMGIINTLRCLNLSIVMNNQEMMVQCAALFEAHRYHATDQQKREYKKMMEEVINDGASRMAEDKGLRVCNYSHISQYVFF